MATVLYIGMETRFQALPSLGSWKKTFTRGFSRKAARPVWKTPSQMISVIIPAHNEETYLPETLEALRRQNYPWFEVIVVANGCTDHTAEAAHCRCHRLIVLSQ